MSDPASSSPNPLDSLAPGVVLRGRYSLKSRVPRWIAERRFKARDLETGEVVAILAWPDSVAWMDSFLDKAEALPTRPFREMERMPGMYLLVTDWGSGMRELAEEANTAEAVLDQLQKCQPPSRAIPPPRRSGSEKISPETRNRALPEAPLPPSPPTRAATWLDGIGLAIGLGVALVVGGFTWQMTQSLQKPLVIEKKTGLSFLKPAQPPGVTLPQLADIQRLRKDGSTTAALVQLLDLNERTPGHPDIQNELNSLLVSLHDDLENLRAGVRPPLVRAIHRAAEAGHAEARRLQEALTPETEKTATSPEPLPIH